MAIVIQFSNSPYPGLRPFRDDESDVFFGREKQIDLLLTRLARNRFLAVIGPSGCGKSSLVKAGLLPALNAGFMAEVGSRWRIVELRPGEKPIRRLTRALAAADLFGPGRRTEEAAALIEATLRRGPLGLVEIVRSAETLRGAALLVLIDQFEETFRYGEASTSDEAEAFVALLLASVSQRDVPIYVVITMRSDYLGECAVFRGLAEAVSNSQYLTPRLTREELELAIAGPARVFGGQVDPKLLNRLSNDFGADPDQLPLLQHALACMWDRHARSDDDAPLLTIDDCEAIGGLRAALSNHADQILAELTPEQQRIAEIMFRRLSGSASGRRDVRAPARVEEIAKIAGVEINDVIAVAEAFARPDRCLLVAPEGPLHADSMLDVCHESLIRQWSRLREWSEQEAQSAETYRLLEQTARRWRKGEAALWSTPDLEVALAWQKREQPSAMWARRYGGDFEQAIEFLRASESKQRADTAARGASRRRQVRRYRHAVYGLGTLMIVIIGAILSWLYGWQWEHAAYYNTFVEKWGVPEGYGRLTADQVRQRASSLKLVTRGLRGPVLRMEAVDRHGQCQPDNPVAQPLDVGASDNLLENQKTLRECRWEYVRDADQHGLIYEKAYNRRGDLVWGLAYTPSTDPSRRQAYFVGPDGSLKLQKNSRLHSVEFNYSKDGNKARDGTGISERYFSYVGGIKHPEPGNGNVYGVVREYGANGLASRKASLGSDHRSVMNDSDGLAIERVTRDRLGNVVETTAFDKNDRPVLVKQGYYRKRQQYDDNGNVVSESYFGIDGRPVRLKDGDYHEVRVRYENGNQVELAYFDIDGRSVNHADLLVHKAGIKYDGTGRAVETRFYDTQGNPTSSVGGQQAAKFSYDRDGNIASLGYFDADGKPVRNLMLGIHRTDWKYDSRGNPISESYFDAAQHPARPKALPAAEGLFNDEAYGKTLGYDDRGNITSMVFVDKKGNPLIGASRYGQMRLTYDDRGNLTEIAFFEPNETPRLLTQTGYAKIRSTYDDRRNVTRQELFDETGALITGPAGYAAVERMYDDRDRVVSEAYFGTDNKPILKDGRYALIEKRYDARNNVIEEAYLDVGHHPVVLGYASLRRKYDDHDRIVEEAYFGADRQPVASADGYAIVRKIFDDSGRIVRLSFLDATGHPTRNEEGCSNTLEKRDVRGHLLEVSCFDEAMKPARTLLGYSEKRSKYDRHGNLLEEAFVDERGGLVRGPKGYAMARPTFDELGHLTSQAFYDIDGKLLVQPFGYAMSHAKYDGPDLLEAAFYGADGKLIVQSDGYAIVRQKYDDRGNVVEQVFYGADGNPLVQSEGFAILRKKSDDRNNLIESAYYGSDNKPAITAWGFATRRSQYDQRDHRTADTYFDQNGKPICLDAVYAKYCRREFVYNRSGLMESVRYTDLDGHPLVTGSFAYDAQGKSTGVRYIGKDGEPLVFRERVRMIEPGFQAEHLLRRGDIVLRYAGTDIDSPETLPRLTRVKSGDTRDVQVLRDGKVLVLKAEPGHLGSVDQTTFARTQ